ncbi:MAG: acyl-CoA reductase-like NAD-dependent aldehyde dehydrogenase [Planctomycetota bacterium]|jgi:acyl-CoA reductase-like NAD-dependent aldehyde dehydrogenase
MVKNFPLMIPGASSNSKLVEVTAPFDNSLIATVQTADEAAAEQALATAHALYEDRDNWLPAHERSAILERAAEIMEERSEELAIEAAREGGKPLMDSRVEVSRAIEGVKLCAEGARTAHGTEIPMTSAASANRLAFTRKEPIGPVMAVSAFNHPLNLIVHQVGPAIATGCPALVKPAAVTPLSCMRFVEILREAGLPDGWCQPVLTASHAVAESMISDPRLGFFSFIGSGAVGWKMRSSLAPGTRCALEHGGVAPVVVAEDADIDDMLPVLAKGGFYHAGQVCVSVQRVYVAESIARKVADGLTKLATALKVGDPTLPDTQVGPLIKAKEVARVHEWITEAVDAGAELLCGGKKLSDSCYAPTVLFNPGDDQRISQAEAFGPVVCIYTVKSIDEAIERANSLPFSFQSSVFTTNLNTALRCYKRLDASAVMVNDHTAFRVDWMPFAGLKVSGYGVGGIEHTMHDMQIEKMAVIRSLEL